MTAASDYLENELLDHSLGTGAYTMPTTVYAALFTASTGLETNAPTTEVSGGSYARQTITFAAASGGSAANNADVTFPVATANWGTLTHVAIMDAASAGNVLYWGAMSASKTVNTDQQFVIPTGSLTISMD